MGFLAGCYLGLALATATVAEHIYLVPDMAVVVVNYHTLDFCG